MKEDRFAAGQLFVLPVETGPQSGWNGANTNLHFTVLCFPSATGEPVLYAAILKSTKTIEDIPLLWKIGIDIRKDIYTGETRFNTFEQNYGEGRAYTGNPKCKFIGKEIKCFVGCSPKAWITLEMLAEMLKVIGNCNLYDLHDKIHPVLLLDGHHSYLKLPLLEFINDDSHKWAVCLGAPYGTHIWQVADSLE
jgi:hypothetical protein